MTFLLVATEALVILGLLTALLWGQGAAAQSDRQQLHSLQTQVAKPNVPPTRTPCPVVMRC